MKEAFSDDNMIEIKIMGLGGQGAVMGAEILADAAFRDGNWSQMIPLYGGVRRGAVVQSFVRIDKKLITIHNAILNPDIVVVLDHKLQITYPITQGLKENGIAILNTQQAPNEIDLGKKLSKIAMVDATKISTEFFGPRPIPITNTTMLGAFSKATGLVNLEALYPCIRERFPGKTGEMNVEMATRGFEEVEVKEV